MAKVGDTLDLNFEVKAAKQGEKLELFFGELVGSLTIVSVYMKNNTSSCDKQIKSLVDSYEDIVKLGANLIVVSKDTVGSHCRYSDKMEAGFIFVSDPNYGFAGAVDSLVEKKIYGRVFTGPTRSAYALDGNGVLLGEIEKIDSAAHGVQVLELLRSL